MRDDAASSAASDACAPVLWLKQAHDQRRKVQSARWLPTHGHNTIQTTLPPGRHFFGRTVAQSTLGQDIFARKYMYE